MAYKLHLPPQWSIQSVFHASLLTPYVKTKEHSKNYLRPPPDLIGGEEQYKVETIRSYRHYGRQRQLQYLIKWKGYPKSDNTWEPMGNLQAPHLVKEYHKCHPLDSINRAKVTSRMTHLPTWLPPTKLAPPTPSVNHLGLTCPCQLETSTTPSSLPPLHTNVARSQTGRTVRLNHLNTSIPMLHSARTPTVSTIARCLKYSTCHASLHPQNLPLHPV
jgi:hypothetical protein